MKTDQLPNDIEAEQHFLSCCMIDGSDSVSCALALGINAESFYDSRHAAVFSAMLHLVTSGERCEPFMVALILKDRGELDKVGGYPFLMSVSQYEPTTAYKVFLAKRIRDAAIRRQLLRANAAISDSASTQDGTPAANVLEEAAKAIMAIDARRERESWAESVRLAESEIAKRVDPARQHEADADALSFGFSDVDRAIGKMRNGQLVVLAARPSVGKSSLARQIAANAALGLGEQVIFASLEVMGKGLAFNMAQTVSGVSAKQINSKSHVRDVDEWMAALKAVQSKSFDVIAASSVSIASISARAEVLRARGTPVRLVVIDYLQLMPDCVPGKNENRAASVGRASRALKAFALANNCVVLALSQLNRDSVKDGREPQLHDLRESGDIEQDADKVLLLHRPNENPITKLTQDETSDAIDVPAFYIRMIQAKGRDDGTGVVGMMFRREITRFEQVQQ